MTTLRPYQEQAINDLLRSYGSCRKVVLNSPTGSGKTVIFSEIARRVARSGKVTIFLVDRVVLVKQAAKHLEKAGLKVGILQGMNTSFDMSCHVLVATVQSCRSRSIPTCFDVGLVVVDECHILHQSVIGLMEKWNNIRFLGLTATPTRKGLGNHFESMVKTLSIEELTSLGYLVPVVPFAPSIANVMSACSDVGDSGGDYNLKDLNKKMNIIELIGDVVSNWQRLGEGRQTLCFCVSIEHARAVAADFVAAGIAAAWIDCTVEDEDRAPIYEAFESGEVTILCSVNMLSIGYDNPSASCAILARPTKSIALHQQQVGRVLRPFDGKKDALLLDHSGNLLRHGLPADFNVDELDTGTGGNPDKSKKDAVKEKGLMPCKQCGFLMERVDLTCTKCGTERTRRESRVSFIDGDLVELSLAEVDPVAFAEEEKAIFYSELLGYCDLKGWKSGWAFHQFKSRFDENPPVLKKKSPPSPATLRWIKSRFIAYNRLKAKEKKAREAAARVAIT